MIIGFTGTRKGMTDKQMYQFLKEIRAIDGPLKSIKEFHHGACVGADEDAVVYLYKATHAIGVIAHPCDIKSMQSIVALTLSDAIWAEDRPLVRNQKIVDVADILIAAPDTATEVLHSGTWATIRRARKKGIPIVMLTP